MRCTIKALPSYFLSVPVCARALCKFSARAPLTFFDPLIMRCYWLFVLSIIPTPSLANFAMPLAPRWDDTRVKHTWNTVPLNWEALGPPPAGSTINLHIALKPRHEDALIDALYAVSDPRSPKYGAHLSREQVAQLVAPHPNTLELIHSWIEHHTVPSSSISMTQGGSGLTLTGVPVSKANEMLRASYQLYRHTGTNDSTILRTIGYALPTVLHDHVQTVAPTTYFASTRTLRLTPRRHIVGATSNLVSRVPPGRKLVTPSQLRLLYKTATYEPVAMGRNELGIAGHLEDYPSPTDLEKFMTKFRLDAVNPDYRVVKINGGEYHTRHPSLEANLNIQLAQGIAYPTPQVFFSTGGESVANPDDTPGEDDMWFAWLNYMLREPNVPQTVSLPYSDFEPNIPEGYTIALCKMFGQLGTRGVSVLVPSGNYGLGKGDCKADNGSIRFIPEFPSSCPWVTSVGGTAGHDPEIAASLSGGGFSDHFERPGYQEVAVPAFLRHPDRRPKLERFYNRGGRGFPDISAQAHNLVIVWKGRGFAVNGTSCSTAILTGIFSLLNDHRLSTGQAQLGFLNPWLYGPGVEGLNDITSGSNRGCGSKGFSAIVGWDPVSGLGTPDFVKLQDIPPLTKHTEPAATAPTEPD